VRFPDLTSQSDASKQAASWDSLFSRLAFLYLLAPSLLFLGFYCKSWPSKILGIGLLGLSLPHLAGFRRCAKPSGLWVALLLAGSVLLLIGFPHGPYCYDWIKHWAIYTTLKEYSWPTEITLHGIPFHLRYYIGSYLVPAGFAKLGLAIPLAVSAGIWLFLGYVILFGLIKEYFAELGEPRSSFGLGLMLFYGGMGFFAFNLLNYPSLDLDVPFGLHYGHWFYAITGVPIQYTPMLGLLIWVPQQSVPTCLVALQLLKARTAQDVVQALGCLGLLTLFSPFGTIGLIPLALVMIYPYRKELWSWARTPFLISCMTFAGAITAYLHTEPVREALRGEFWVSNYPSLMEYLLFLLVALGPSFIILRGAICEHRILSACFLTLLCIPLVRFGTPDFSMRSSIGPLFLVGLFCSRTLASISWEPRGWNKALILLGWFLCCPTALSEMEYHLTHGRLHSLNAVLNTPWYMQTASSTHIDFQAFLDQCGHQFQSQYLTRKQPLPWEDAVPVKGVE